MARGAEAKATVWNKVLETFDGAFEYGKEIRIPMEDNGERVEIKVTLACAKENVGGGEADSVELQSTPVEPKTTAAPTPEEKENIAKLMDRLGL